MEVRHLVLGLSLGGLVACGAVGGMAGMSMGEALSYGHIGTSVVCLGSDAGDRAWDWREDGAWNIQGTVVSQDRDGRSVGNVDPCWGPPSRVIVIEDEAGATWALGYRWHSNSMGDTTPEISVEEGDTVSVVYRPGETPGSAGFAVFDEDDSLVYAIESGRAGRGLQDHDVPGLTVNTGEVVGSGTTDDGCEQSAYTLEFETATGDTSSLPPGGDDRLVIDEGTSGYTLCNINSYESDCDNDVPESSWILFNGGEM
ncbi:MAG TPA: hypothetical protein QGF58_10790 [Myxococcota bacterium]|nr:hypothetical protein [Myxococcota bacterium]